MLGQRRENVKTLCDAYKLGELRVLPDAPEADDLLAEITASEKMR